MMTFIKNQIMGTFSNKTFILKQMMKFLKVKWNHLKLELNMAQLANLKSKH